MISALALCLSLHASGPVATAAQLSAGVETPRDGFTAVAKRPGTTKPKTGGPEKSDPRRKPPISRPPTTTRPGGPGGIM